MPPPALASGLGLLAACSAGVGPEELARAVAEARIAGDQVRLRSLLSTPDSAAAARYLGTDTLERIGDHAGGEPGAVLDSVRLIRTAGDSAWVQVALTVPSWDRIDGGRFYFDENTRYRDRVQDQALVASLPRVQDRWTIRLLRERGSWRWRPFLDIQTEENVHDFRSRDPHLPLARRLAHLDSILAIVGLDPARRTAVTRDRAMLAATDSISLAFAVVNRWFGGEPVRVTQVDFTSRSRTRIPLLIVELEGADGKTETAMLDVPASGRGQGWALKPMALPIRAWRVRNAIDEP